MVSLHQLIILGPFITGNFPKAIEYFKIAVKIDEGLGNEAETANTILNIGNIYVLKVMQEMKKAESSFEKI